MTIPSGLLASLALLLGLVLLLPLLPRQSRLARLAAAAVVVTLNVRYVAWRWADTLPRVDLAFEPLFAWTYFALEALAVACATWHVLIMVAPSDRREEADEAERRLSTQARPPSVDVFIATYNEPRHVLEPTIAAALSLDYPQKTVWVLDDGGRPWLEALARARGARYLARTERKGFKAGNLNHGLAHATGEVVACLDADFVVAPRFLSRTVGLLACPETALVQTPQFFANPDAVQANLDGGSAWPDEQRVFFDVVQPARDAFDNAFCHGTSFVVRRRALDEIGGFPEASLCEDLYTTYRLKERGYVTRYLNERLSVGIAAQSLPEFLKQRCRWCLGTLQCLWLPSGPLRSRRLGLLDRLFFLDPVLFYLSSIYVLLTLCAPAVFWWTGASVFHSKLGHLLSMFAPRMGASMAVLYWISGRRVVPIVSEIGRAVCIVPLSRAVLHGLFRPFREASFQVTSKARAPGEAVVHWPILRPFLAIALATVAGMAINLGGLYEPTFWSEDLGMNVSLTALVLWMLFLCGLACIDRPHRAAEPVQAEGDLARSLAAIARRIFGRDPATRATPPPIPAHEP